MGGWAFSTWIAYSTPSVREKHTFAAHREHCFGNENDPAGVPQHISFLGKDAVGEFGASRALTKHIILLLHHISITVHRAPYSAINRSIKLQGCEQAAEAYTWPCLISHAYLYTNACTRCSQHFRTCCPGDHFLFRCVVRETWPRTEEKDCWNFFKKKSICYSSSQTSTGWRRSPVGLMLPIKKISPGKRRFIDFAIVFLI